MRIDPSEPLDVETCLLPLARRAMMVATLALGACSLRVYQPMMGLHRPVVVDPTAQNFQDLRLTVYCVPQDLLSLSEASKLCRRVGTMFENQGAIVTTTVGGPKEDFSGDDDDDDEDAVVDAVPEQRTDLTLELRARKVHSAHHPLSWVASAFTFTLTPGITEVTFQQDTAVRDGTGFLLATDSLQGRVVTYFGVGTWAGNQVMNLGIREKEDKISGERSDRELSSDMYKQLSQSVYNAKVQWQLQQQGRP